MKTISLLTLALSTANLALANPEIGPRYERIPEVQVSKTVLEAEENKKCTGCWYEKEAQMPDKEPSTQSWNAHSNPQR